MTATATFHLGDLLSFTTGALVSPDHMDGIYKVAEFMTDGPVWTHQLIRLAEPVKAEILAQHPQLTEVQAPKFDGPDRESRESVVMAWVQEQVTRYGEQFTLTRRPDVFGVLHQRDPIEAAVEMVGPDRVLVVLVVNPDEDGES